MSKVISFRLNPYNQREVQALEILKTWQEKGYSSRYIMTVALLLLDSQQATPATKVSLEDLNEALNQVTRLLIRLDDNQTLKTDQQNDDISRQELTSSFISAVKKASKSGLKLG